MNSYERVTYRQEGASRSKTVVLRNTEEARGLLRGIEVNRDGDEVAAPGFDQRLRIISVDLISKRTPMTMDLHYGTLVVA